MLRKRSRVTLGIKSVCTDRLHLLLLLTNAGGFGNFLGSVFPKVLSSAARARSLIIGPYNVGFSKFVISRT